jgi:uncharacterized protein (DUF1697 family)
MPARKQVLISHVALLRAVNVGGKNKLPMADLVAMFEAAGCADVRHYIQSGNVVFRASTELARKIPSRIGEAIRKKFGFQPPLVVRSGAEMKVVVRANPFLRSGADPSHLHVAFLASAPGNAEAEALDPQRSPHDKFVLRGADIFLCFSKGVAGTKLTNAYFDSKLKTVSTLRNWATVLKLAEMSGD